MAVRVVLARTLYAGNVGSALRAAANFGAEALTLVGPLCPLDDPEVERMAMGARRHLTLSVVATLAEAVSASDVVVATTSGRARDARHLHTPDEVADLLQERGVHRVALAFGPERGGLSLAELRECHLLMAIPTNPDFPVLNLAQTVAVALAALTPAPPSPRLPAEPLDATAPIAELQVALDHLARALARSGFLDPANPNRVMDQLRRLIGRALPSSREVAILRGLASEIERLLPDRGKATLRD
jgi:TrmH family RNA methyltransferase